ncbi:MAG TPA: hypothetical protein VK796_05075 [Cytophaga sp.]|jgi:hypothetical protein|nr:hypothetical protein [Cytophaga sp.]
MRDILLIIFIPCVAFCAKAERIIEREKYNLIIASDTVYMSEDYQLTVDLKGNKNAIVYSNTLSLPIYNDKAYLKFKASAAALDKNGMSKQRVKITVVIGKDSLYEDVTYFVARSPMSNSIRRVQDSLTIVLLKKEDYKDIHDASYYQKYFIGFASEFGNSVLKEDLGQLLVFLVVDSKGKVVKYDIVKNTYKTIPLEKIQQAIESYQLEDFESAGNLKFSAVIYTVKGYRGNIVVCSER